MVAYMLMSQRMALRDNPRQAQFAQDLERLRHELQERRGSLGSPTETSSAGMGRLARINSVDAGQSRRKTHSWTQK